MSESNYCNFSLSLKCLTDITASMNLITVFAMFTYYFTAMTMTQMPDWLIWLIKLSDNRPCVALRRRPCRSRTRQASSAHATTASLRLPVCVTSTTIGSPLGVSIGTLYTHQFLFNSAVFLLQCMVLNPEQLKQQKARESVHFRWICIEEWCESAKRNTGLTTQY